MRVRLVQRPTPRPSVTVLATVLSLVGALLLGAIFFLLTDRPPLTVYSKMLEAAFGSGEGIKDTLAASTPLILTGLAAAFAMSIGLYNIGGEGQLYAGAIASSGAALLWTESMSAPMATLVVFAAGALGGMVWIVIPTLARAFAGTSEVITTLMMVFVADKVLDYLILSSKSFWRDPLTIGFPQGKRIPEAAQFARWFDGSRITIALPVAALMVVACWVVVKKSGFGFDMEVIGGSPLAARYAGIHERRSIIVTLLVSGSLAGMAGAAEVGARAYQLDPAGLRLSLGFTGIVIAALARHNPFGVALVAVLLGGLHNAGRSVQAVSAIDVPKSVSLMLQGGILLFVLGGEVFRRYRLNIVRVPQLGTSA